MNAGISFGRGCALQVNEISVQVPGCLANKHATRTTWRFNHGGRPSTDEKSMQTDGWIAVPLAVVRPFNSGVPPVEQWD